MHLMENIGHFLNYLDYCGILFILNENIIQIISYNRKYYLIFGSNR